MEFRSRIASTLAKIESMLASGGDGGKFMEAFRPLLSASRNVVLETRSKPSSRCSSAVNMLNSVDLYSQRAHAVGNICKAHGT